MKAGIDTARGEMMRPYRPCRRRGVPALDSRGFTMLEILIVLVILAGLAAGGVYMMSLLTHGQLKDEAMRMTSTIQYTSNQAALNNRNYRLVIDLDSQEYYTEVTESSVIIDATSEEAEEAFDEGLLPEELREQEAEERAGHQDLFDEEEHDPFGISRRTGYQRAEDMIVEPRKLRHGIEFHSVRTEVRPQEVIEGRVAISFFPSGLQQQAVIVLVDPATEAKFTLITEPLTGRVRAYNGELEGPEEFGPEEYDG